MTAVWSSSVRPVFVIGAALVAPEAVARDSESLPEWCFVTRMHTTFELNGEGGFRVTAPHIEAINRFHADYQHRAPLYPSVCPAFTPLSAADLKERNETRAALLFGVYWQYYVAARAWLQRTHNSPHLVPFPPFHI